ncbi:MULTISPECIES: hypothetical protein [Clostridium]|uniref:Uncharacterized protein n=1 Tax=Clostridium botulinum (strain Eklund 17B / Type B) TaxID=935198 RepID=B2TRK7_CLOBB|nr:MULTISPECIES: hypothetical protein [Clostridium]ACD24513.1 hypothetical protein CLL_A2377 [Clostridium botulinum B str. Eklund 17B (NRP)]MBY6975897.1 hypothetical protein [Clostridium botulinum]MBY7000320.1 hypothetical protein [Clostridium botulinum]MBZ9692057.1 hypothetical protein [Clostridium sp. M14]MCR1273080.1 hypothetical protein [Clostridium botulinum]
MIKECKKGYDVNIRKFGVQTNVILPFAFVNNDGTSSIRCKTDNCEFINVCEYKDYIKD